MEWTVVGVIVVLVGLGVSIVTPIVKLTKQITSLCEAVNGLRHDIDRIETHNSESHNRIYGTLEEHDKTLNNHEMRIHDLEGGVKHE